MPCDKTKLIDPYYPHVRYILSYYGHESISNQKGDDRMKKMFTTHTPDTHRREELLHRIERLTELPLLVLSFIMIPLLIGPLFWELSSSEETIFLTLDTFIWAIFAIDLTIKFIIVTQRLPYLKRHWLEVLVVIVPFLRPLRVIRILIFGSRAWVGARRLVNIDFLLVYGLGLIIIAATVVASVEGGENASIQSFPDALWWAVATITTVGYGDKVPISVAGRAAGYVLMFGGIAFFSGFTANLASFLVRSKNGNEKVFQDLSSEVAGLRKEITRLRSQISQQSVSDV
ncbi:MAG: potassium channel family protein [Dehalococcoidia bacterium]|nr:potassium channel family protein [Dehalococcoidia bacterium]